MVHSTHVPVLTKHVQCTYSCISCKVSLSIFSSSICSTKCRTVDWGREKVEKMQRKGREKAAKHKYISQQIKIKNISKNKNDIRVEDNYSISNKRNEEKKNDNKNIRQMTVKTQILQLIKKNKLKKYYWRAPLSLIIFLLFAIFLFFIFIKT